MLSWDQLSNLAPLHLKTSGKAQGNINEKKSSTWLNLQKFCLDIRFYEKTLEEDMGNCAQVIIFVISTSIWKTNSENKEKYQRWNETTMLF